MVKQFMPYLMPVLVMGLVFWRMRKQSQGRPLKPNRLWVRPAMLALFALLAFIHPAPITPLSLAIFVLCAAAGVGLGYLSARHQQLTLDPATGAIISKMSPVGIALFLAIFASRYIVRLVVEGGQPPGPFEHPSSSVLTYTDAALLFALGLVAAQAWEIWRRAKALLGGASKLPDSVAG
ncbi:CcdC protein domain-containing protein [Rhizomicrobium electricum]|jgi:hypothetical protein|uniref:DUF1453 domain-containing protein n=1 Tax=Rhizomicrobium electricum TaxID=480070 RepID=A0ABN1E396_9PROT|nr:CcdC protein domain-containing protein [Rhizomicrobium electricum]NIJ47514.1 hypothetical protein [Rhizomicrobium electricum]